MDDKQILCNDDFLENAKAMYSEVYTLEQLKKKFVIESQAYGGMLCRKKRSDDMILFQQITSPLDEKEVYYIKLNM